MADTPTMRSQFEALPEMIEQSVVSYGREEFYGLADWATFEAGIDKGLEVAAKLVRDTLSSAKEPQTEGWRSMESAPKDGTRILGFFPNLENGFHDTAWIERLNTWASRDYPVQPTLWMPLPALPSSGGGHE